MRGLFFRVILVLSLSSTLLFSQELSTEDKNELKVEANKRGMTTTELMSQLQAKGVTNKEEAIAVLKSGEVTSAKDKESKIDATEINVTSESIAKEEIVENKQLENIKPSNIPETNVQYFGYEIFHNRNMAFTVDNQSAVDPNYIVGPGDILKITIWGNVDLTQELPIDKSGRIYLKNIGPVTVMGISINSAQEKLKSLYGKNFSGLNGTEPNTWIDVSVTNMKPKQIFIMGEVNAPGGYTVNSNSTVFNSLFSIGGPTTNGSLRDVRVIRDNKTIATIDFYDFLIGAKNTNDVRVQNGDIIFVPPRLSSITIKGEVNKEKIFELKKDETALDLINYAGGVKTTAFANRAVIHRVKPISERTSGNQIDRTVLDFDLQKVLTKKSIVKLYDLDIVNIYSITDEYHNFIDVTGEIFSPGKVAFEEGMTIKEAIQLSGGLLATTYLEKAELIRTKEDKTKESFSLSLENLDGVNGEFKLQSKDFIRIFKKVESTSNYKIYLKGLIDNNDPINYADGITLYDVLFDKAQIKDSMVLKDIYQSRGDIVRLDKANNTKKLITFKTSDIVSQDKNITLQPEDAIYIYPANFTDIVHKFVQIDGEVKTPGVYELTEGMTIADLISLSNGFTKDYEANFAEISRVVATSNDNDISQNIKVPLHGIETSNSSDFVLQHRDVIHIRKDPNYTPLQFVSIEGAIQYPGKYALNSRTEKLSSILKRCGGYKSNAYPEASIFMRNEMNVVIDFKDIDKNQDNDVILHDGDKIIIKSRPNTVFISGEVNTAGLLGYRNGADMWEYINAVGNLTDSANFILLTEPNGVTRKYSKGCFSRNCWGNPTVKDGSSINVTKIPTIDENDNRIDWNGVIKDIPAIITSIGTIALLYYSIKTSGQ